MIRIVSTKELRRLRAIEGAVMATLDIARLWPTRRSLETALRTLSTLVGQKPVFLNLSEPEQEEQQKPTPMPPYVHRVRPRVGPFVPVPPVTASIPQSSIARVDVPPVAGSAWYEELSPSPQWAEFMSRDAADPEPAAEVRQNCSVSDESSSGESSGGDTSCSSSSDSSSSND